MSSEWAASPVPKRMTFAGCVNACPVTNTTRPASRLNRLPLGRILQAVMPGRQTTCQQGRSQIYRWSTSAWQTLLTQRDFVARDGRVVEPAAKTEQEDWRAQFFTCLLVHRDALLHCFFESWVWGMGMHGNRGNEFQSMFPLTISCYFLGTALHAHACL